MGIKKLDSIQKEVSELEKWRGACFSQLEALIGAKGGTA